MFVCRTISQVNFCNKVIRDFYGIFVYKFKKIIEKPIRNFSGIFKRIVNSFKNVEYNLYIMQQTACLVLKPIMIESYAAFCSCTEIVQASGPNYGFDAKPFKINWLRHDSCLWLVFYSPGLQC